MHANKRDEIEEVLAGDIAAAIGLKDTRTGDTLSDEDKPIILEAMKFPNPVIDVAIEPKTKADQDKLGTALQKLQEEDPDVPGPLRRGDRPDDHRRHGRAAPRDPRRPDEARVQGRGQRRQAPGGVPGDGQEGGHQRRGEVHPPVRRQGPVRPRGDQLRAERAGRGLRLRGQDRRRRRFRGSSSSRSRPASGRRWRTACWPGTRWWTSRRRWSSAATTTWTAPKWRSRSRAPWRSRRRPGRRTRSCSSR